jgi:Glycosyltransferase family 87
MMLGQDREHRGPPRSSRAAVALGASILFYVAVSVALFWPLLVSFYWPAGGGLDVTGHPIGRDFINVWAGPQLAFGGRLATLFDLEGYHAALGGLFGQSVPPHNWGYPLFTLPVFWPLAQLPYFVALAVWTAGLFAIFAAVTLSQVERPSRPFALVALALAPACLINAVGGQNGFLTASLFLGGVLLIDRRPVLAGFLFGLLTFKPHLGLVLPFALLALGAWRVMAAAAVTALALFAGSAALFGIEPWRQYFEITGPYQAQLLERFRGFYTFMMVSGLAGARTFGLSYPVALAAQIALALPVLAAACWAIRATSDRCRRAFVLASAAPLISPYAFNYDLTALAAVLVWQLCRPGAALQDLIRSPILLLGWMTPLLAMYLNADGIGLAPVALAAVFALSLHEAAADRAIRRSGSGHLPARP